jgi:nitrous oxidase accessory protein NosD
MNWKFGINLLAVSCIALAFSVVAHAQATRTWVSGVGDDVNPCSRTAPCKTFAGAISKTAAGGEIDCLDPGGFGALTITKSIIIDCRGGVGSVLSSGVQGIVVSADAALDAVTIRNLSISGAGTTLGTNGVAVTSAKSVHLENVTLNNYSNAGLLVNTTTATKVTLENVTIADVQNGIIATASSGIATLKLHRVDISNVPGDAVRAGVNSKIAVRDSTISMCGFGINQTSGVGTGPQVLVSQSSITGATTALQSVSGGYIGLAASTVTYNNLIYNTNGGTILTGGDNVGFGNGSIGATSGSLPKV